MKGIVAENLGHGLILVTDKELVQILSESLKKLVKIHRKRLVLSIILIFLLPFLVNILKIVIVQHKNFHMTPYMTKLDEKY